MAEKRCVIALAIVNVLFLAGLIFWYVKQDRVPPVITLEEAFVYEEAMVDEDILSGVSAVDDRDGDVSHTLVVEKIGLNETKRNALITCGARDNSGNMEKYSFYVECDPAVFISEENQTEEEGNTFELVAGEAANMVAESSEEEDSDAADPENAEAENETTDEEENDEEVDEENNQETEDEVEENNPEITPEQPAQTPKPEEAARPIIQFSAGEVKTSIGYNPAWVTVISQLKDDKDSYEYLLGNLKISGDFDNTTQGNYDVSVTTTDSDGNESAPSAIRIIVE